MSDNPTPEPIPASPVEVERPKIPDRYVWAEKNFDGDISSTSNAFANLETACKNGNPTKDTLYLLRSPDEVSKEESELARMRKQVESLKASAGFCKEHLAEALKGGSRNCLVCGCKELSGAISRIDYALGEPNEMETSLFDVDQNEERVVERVKTLRKEVEELRVQNNCNGCGKPLDRDNLFIADGCPCNSERGINHGKVSTLTCTCDVCDPRKTGAVRLIHPDTHWRLLEANDKVRTKLSAAEERARLAEEEAKRLRDTQELWPEGLEQMERYELPSDMDPTTRLVGFVEVDGDVCLSIVSVKAMLSVEFCTLAGGGKYPLSLRAAALRLIDEMRKAARDAARKEGK